MTWFAKTRAAQPDANAPSPQEFSPAGGRGSVESLTRQIGGQLLAAGPTTAVGFVLRPLLVRSLDALGDE